MLLDKYIVIKADRNRWGGIGPAKAELREREPKLDGNEIALRLRIEIPDALFKRPILEARMSIPDAAVPSTSITPEVTDSVEKIIKDVTGLEMRINIVEYKESEPEAPAVPTPRKRN